MNKQKSICFWLLTGYSILMVCLAVCLREPKGNLSVRREVHWEYYRSLSALLSPDVINNILAFIPIGILVGLLSARYRLLKAILAGLFLSETIECSQLIWKRGVFDADDLLNNTLGAMIGGLGAVTIVSLLPRGTRNSVTK